MIDEKILHEIIEAGNKETPVMIGNHPVIELTQEQYDELSNPKNGGSPLAGKIGEVEG